MAHRPLLKKEAEEKDKTKGFSKHKGINFLELGDGEENGKKIYKVVLPGGHKFRIAAKDEADAKKELDKVAK